jgi:hypothetical protein
VKDQLTNCPNDSLRNALYKALGDRIDTINVEDLMKEIEELAVVRQSNNVNTLAMITAKQRQASETVCSTPSWTYRCL